jgi:DNA-binding response OmpR family regulator
MLAAEAPSIPDPAAFTPGRFPDRVPLGPDCWYEPDLALVICRVERRLLTPREEALLQYLLEAPNRWHKTAALAAALDERLGLEEISEGSIRQTVMGLRNKLGDSAKAPTLLQCRPGHGYGLFPQETPRIRP